MVDAVNDVYHQGEGARKQVFIIIPDSVSESKTGIDSKTATIYVLGNDVWAEADVNMVGSFPTTRGGHFVWVEAKANYVLVGETMMGLNKSSIYVSMNQSDTAQESITITNYSSAIMDINITQNWPHTDVTLAVSPTSFSQNPGDQNIVYLDFTSSATAVGNYVGSITITATYNGNEEAVEVPINAEVIVAAEESPLIVIPSTWTATIQEGEKETKTFTVCNNSSSSMTNIQFAGSGDAGAWLEADTIPSLAADSCTEQDLNISVPLGTAEGTYYGTITAQSDEGYSDTIDLEITVTAAPAQQTILLWAQIGEGGSDPAAIVGTADDVASTENRGDMYGYSFDTSTISGSIDQVELIWSHSILDTLADDSVDLKYGISALTTTKNTYNSTNTPVDNQSPNELDWEIIDVTADRSWTIDDITNLWIGGTYNRVRGPDSLWYLDAVGVRVTYTP